MSSPISPAFFDEKMAACKSIAIDIINSFIEKRLSLGSYVTIYLKEFKEAIPEETSQSDRSIIVQLFPEMEKVFKDAGWNVGYIRAYQYHDVTDAYMHFSKNMDIKLS